MCETSATTLLVSLALYRDGDLSGELLAGEDVYRVSEKRGYSLPFFLFSRLRHNACFCFLVLLLRMTFTSTVSRVLFSTSGLNRVPLSWGVALCDHSRP
jgi:hypothetical protein